MTTTTMTPSSPLQFSAISDDSIYSILRMTLMADSGDVWEGTQKEAETLAARYHWAVMPAGDVDGPWRVLG